MPVDLLMGSTGGKVRAVSGWLGVDGKKGGQVVFNGVGDGGLF